MMMPGPSRATELASTAAAMAIAPSAVLWARLAHDSHLARPAARCHAGLSAAHSRRWPCTCWCSPRRMTTVDLDTLIAALDPAGLGGRGYADDIAAMIRSLTAHLGPAAVPELVRDTIQRGEQQARWAVARTAMVLRRRVATVPAASAPSPAGSRRRRRATR